MIDSLLFSILTLIGGINSNVVINSANNALDSFSTTFSDTYKISDNQYITFFHSGKNVDELSREDDYSTSTQTRCFINDKYVIVGDSSSSQNEYVLVGKTPFLAPFGSMTMKTFVELDLSLFPDSGTILSAGLVYKKQSGILNSIDYSLVTNCSFASLNGNSSYSSTYIGSSSYDSHTNDFTFNLGSQIINYLNNDIDSMILVLEGDENNKSSQLYSTRSSTNYPLLYVVHTGQYGNAPVYIEDSASHSQNCWGYVKNIGKNPPVYEIIPQSPNPLVQYDPFEEALGDLIVDDYVMDTIVFDVVCDYFPNNSIRLLESYNSLIGPNERRIACRLMLDHRVRYSSQFHFVCQCADGSWACVFGSSGTFNYLSPEEPENNNSSMWYNGMMNSPILYFAYETGV